MLPDPSVNSRIYETYSPRTHRTYVVNMYAPRVNHLEGPCRPRYPRQAPYAAPQLPPKPPPPGECDLTWLLILNFVIYSLLILCTHSLPLNLLTTFDFLLYHSFTTAHYSFYLALVPPLPVES